MQKAVFLDRDGVINSDVGHYYVYKPEAFIINEHLFDALVTWQERGFIFVVISNQGGISKKQYSKSDVDLVHEKLIEQASDKGIKFEEIYYCPHHSSVENCLCRKPQSLMIEKALDRFSIDRSKSYLIGDSDRDIEAAINAGIKGIKVAANQSLLTIVDEIK